MAENPITSWALYCDRCKEQYDNGEFAFWLDSQGALDAAEADDWIRVDGKDFCSVCVTPADLALSDVIDAQRNAWKIAHRKLMCVDGTHAFSDYGVCLACYISRDKIEGKQE